MKKLIIAAIAATLLTGMSPAAQADIHYNVHSPSRYQQPMVVKYVPVRDFFGRTLYYRAVYVPAPAHTAWKHDQRHHGREMCAR